MRRGTAAPSFSKLERGGSACVHVDVAENWCPCGPVRMACAYLNGMISVVSGVHWLVSISLSVCLRFTLLCLSVFCLYVCLYVCQPTRTCMVT